MDFASAICEEAQHAQGHKFDAGDIQKIELITNAILAHMSAEENRDIYGADLTGTIPDLSRRALRRRRRAMKHAAVDALGLSIAVLLVNWSLALLIDWVIDRMIERLVSNLPAARAAIMAKE